MLVGHVTLRLLKPACDLDEAWEQEDLDTAALRTILLLHSHTVPQREARTSGEHRAAAAAFFPPGITGDKQIGIVSLNICICFFPSSAFCSCFLLLLPSAQCQTARVVRQHRGDGEHDDQGFASRPGTLQASRQHGQHRLRYRRGKGRRLCISAVRTGGPETVTLPGFRVDQSCSHVSTCSCF